MPLRPPNLVDSRPDNTQGVVGDEGQLLPQDPETADLAVALDANNIGNLPIDVAANSVGQLGVALEASSITDLPVDIVSNSVGDLGVSLNATNVGDLPVSIAASEIESLPVEIAANTLGNVPIDLTAASVGDLGVSLNATNVGSLPVDIESNSVGQLGVDVEAQTLGSLGVDVEAQSAGDLEIFDQTNFSRINSAVVENYPFTADETWTIQEFVAFDIPADKRLSITTEQGDTASNVKPSSTRFVLDTIRIDSLTLSDPNGSGGESSLLWIGD